MTFVVREKIVRQAVLSGQIAATCSAEAIHLKSLALRSSAIGIVSILVVVTLAGAISASVKPAFHRDAAFTAIIVNLAVFLFQHRLIVRATRQFNNAFPEDDSPRGP
jgi:hypothetical protein